jgi:hypothetical protein
MSHDRTLTAARRQLRGLGLHRFEVSILRGEEHNSATVWSVDQILGEKLASLKKANKAGANILVRPPRDLDHDLVLLDDIDRFTPDRMKASGHAPAVVVETSPGNCQAWVRLGVPCPAPVRHEIARELARLYGGDPGAVDPHKSGRLAGFTNRKPEHQTSRGFPFVLLLNAPGKPVSAAEGLIQNAKIAVEATPANVTIEIGDANKSLIEAWRDAYNQGHPDLSAVDWSCAHQCLAAGVDPDDVAAALAEVADRKGKYAEKYAQRTVAAAVRDRANVMSGDNNCISPDTL